jgi:hypothetical protein
MVRNSGSWRADNTRNSNQGDNRFSIVIIDVLQTGQHFAVPFPRTRSGEILALDQ